MIIVNGTIKQVSVLLMNKKAVSELISYVLIIGLSIALAVAIGLWSKGESKRVVETTVTEAETDARCAEVHLGGVKCMDQNSKVNTKIKNRGSFSISSLRYICTDTNGADIAGKIDLDIDLKPGVEQSLNNINGCDTNKDITLTPFIKIEDRLVICSEGKKVIEGSNPVEVC